MFNGQNIYKMKVFKHSNKSDVRSQINTSIAMIFRISNTDWLLYLRLPRKYLKYHRVWYSGFSKIGVLGDPKTYKKKYYSLLDCYQRTLKFKVLHIKALQNSLEFSKGLLNDLIKYVWRNNDSLTLRKLSKYAIKRSIRYSLDLHQ